MTIRHNLLIAFLISCSLTGCFESSITSQDLPVANNENCTDEKILRLKDELRKKMASACARRSNFKPSTPRDW